MAKPVDLSMKIGKGEKGKIDVFASSVDEGISRFLFRVYFEEFIRLDDQGKFFFIINDLVVFSAYAKVFDECLIDCCVYALVISRLPVSFFAFHLKFEVQFLSHFYRIILIFFYYVLAHF